MKRIRLPEDALFKEVDNLKLMNYAGHRVTVYYYRDKPDSKDTMVASARYKTPEGEDLSYSVKYQSFDVEQCDRATQAACREVVEHYMSVKAHEQAPAQILQLLNDPRVIEDLLYCVDYIIKSYQR